MALHIKAKENFRFSQSYAKRLECESPLSLCYEAPYLSICLELTLTLRKRATLRVFVSSCLCVDFFAPYLQ